jgi:CheY-like chemotaxis protein
MSYRIVIADDSDDDLFLFKRALKRACASMDVVTMLRDGKEAVAYLKGQGEYADRQKFPLPELLLLDIKMPCMSGLEVLEWLQTQHFPEMRVIILSGSGFESDKETAKRLNADAYMIKPADPDGLDAMVGTLAALC